MTSTARRARRLGIVTLAIVAVAAGCGGGDEGASTASTAAPADSAAPDTNATPDTAAVPDTSAAPDTTAGPDTTAAPASTVPPATEFEPLVLTTASAGPLSVAASECTIEGVDPLQPGSWDAMGLSATHAFVPAEGGVAALAFTPGVGCTLVLDTAVGDQGLLATPDSVDFVSATVDNKVAASGVFSTTVFDVALGQSFTCENASGYAAISPDGAQLVTTFPGSPIARFDLSDTTCTEAGEIPLPADVTDLYYFGHAGSDYYLGGAGADGTVYATLTSGGAVQWKVGNPEVSGLGWIGWVHGMAPCNGGHCIVDTNTDKLIVTDAAGTVRAEFEIGALIGQRLFYHSLAAGSDGALYLLASDRGDDGAGGSVYLNHVVRLEVTG